MRTSRAVPLPALAVLISLTAAVQGKHIGQDRATGISRKLTVLCEKALDVALSIGALTRAPGAYGRECIRQFVRCRQRPKASQGLTLPLLQRRPFPAVSALTTV